MNVRINVPAIISECLETAVRGFLWNDFLKVWHTALDEGARSGDFWEYLGGKPEALERLLEQLDHRFWCELDERIRFPEFHEDTP